MNKPTPGETEGLRAEQPDLVGICWVEETFWWDATNSPLCPACSADYAEEHELFVSQAEVLELREALDAAERQRDAASALKPLGVGNSNENDWEPGDPCGSCGSTRTGWDTADGATCADCGRTDADG